jgi:hypothetical protein
MTDKVLLVLWSAIFTLDLISYFLQSATFWPLAAAMNALACIGLILSRPMRGAP